MTDINELIERLREGINIVFNPDIAGVESDEINAERLMRDAADALEKQAAWIKEICAVRDNATSALLRASDDIARLTAIVERLPVTADGVPVVPGIDTVYRAMHAGRGEYVIQGMFDTAPHLIALSYSTREAAEAAKETP